MLFVTLSSYYNPAAAGLDSKLNIVGMYSMQMVGYEGAPKTMVINADMPLFFIGPKHGVGAAFLNDAIGAYSNKKIQLQYAFHQKFLGGRASIGIRPALLMVGFNGSKLDLKDPNDPAFATNDVKGNAFESARADSKTGRRQTASSHDRPDVHGARRIHPHIPPPTIQTGNGRSGTFGPAVLARRHQRPTPVRRRQTQALRRPHVQPHHQRRPVAWLRLPRHQHRLLIRSLYRRHRSPERHTRDTHRISTRPGCLQERKEPPQVRPNTLRN